MIAQIKPWKVREEDFPRTGSREEQLAFLLNYAILAPSSHNTQPWKFAVYPDSIDLRVDPERWLRVADADQRELYLSAGCALENLLIAAEGFGLTPRTRYFPDPTKEAWVAQVVFDEPTSDVLRDTRLFRAILSRHTNRKIYDERPISAKVLQSLETAAEDDGIRLFLTNHSQTKEHIEQLMVEADARQFADPAWREELGYWMGAGAFGQPWLVAKMAALAVTYLNMGKGTAQRDRSMLMSAPELAVIATSENTRLAQVRAGQAFERVCLTAEAQDVRVHPMNQILQIPELKAEFSKLIPMPGFTPQICFRLGYAEAEKEHTPRRPVHEVLV